MQKCFWEECEYFCLKLTATQLPKLSRDEVQENFPIVLVVATAQMKLQCKDWQTSSLRGCQNSFATEFVFHFLNNLHEGLISVYPLACHNKRSFVVFMCVRKWIIIELKRLEFGESGNLHRNLLELCGTLIGAIRYSGSVFNVLELFVLERRFFHTDDYAIAAVDAYLSHHIDSFMRVGW